MRSSRFFSAVSFILIVTVAISLAACRRQPPPLIKDLEVAKREARQDVEAARWKAATAMTLEQAGALQAAWTKNPDLETAKTLLTFYSSHLFRKDPENPQALIAGRRQVILWLIEHHPEHQTTVGAYIVPENPGWPDPKGYAEARRVWLAHTSRPDASAAILANAASFFGGPDPFLAERLLLRARDLDLSNRLSVRLGYLHGAMIGASNLMPGPNYSIRVASELKRHASEIEQKVAASTDSILLTEAGMMLTRAREPRHVALGRTFLKRAVELQPEATTSPEVSRAKSVLMSWQLSDERQSLQKAFRDKQIELAGGEAEIEKKTGGSRRARN